MKLRSPLWIALGIAVLGVSLPGCVNREAQAQAEKTKAIVTDPTIAVKAVSVELKDMPVELQLTGSLIADDDVAITAKSAGQLVAVYVREGQSVKAGQLIAKQESRDGQARLRQAQAQVRAAQAQLDQVLTDSKVSPTKSAAAVAASEARLRQSKAALQKLLNGARIEEKRQSKANLDRAKSDLETAEKARDRSKRLFDQGAIAKAELEAAENRYQSALAGYTSALESYNLVLDSVRPEDIESAREQVRQAEQQLAVDKANQKLDPVLQQRVDAARANVASAQESENLARLALADLNVYAPVSGKISGRPLQAGTYAGPGTQIARLIGVSGMFFEAEVPEREIASLTVGLPVDVTIQSLNNLSLSGQILSSDPLASDLGRLYRVRVAINEQIAQLKAGMFAVGSVRLRVDSGSLVIPDSAIVRDGEEAFVYAIENGEAVRRAIKIRYSKDGLNVIEGLQAGEQVITAGKSEVVPGSKVKVEDGTVESSSESGSKSEEE